MRVSLLLSISFATCKPTSVPVNLAYVLWITSLQLTPQIAKVFFNSLSVACRASEASIITMSERGSAERAAQAFELHLLSSCSSNKSAWQQPWETGLLYHDPRPRPVQSTAPLPGISLKPSIPEPAQETVCSNGLKRPSVLEQMDVKLSKQRIESWSDKRDEDRSLAVSKWKKLVADHLMAFTVARDFYQSTALGFKGRPLMTTLQIASV